MKTDLKVGDRVKVANPTNAASSNVVGVVHDVPEPWVVVVWEGFGTLTHRPHELVKEAKP